MVALMKRCSLRLVLLLIGVWLMPWNCPAPLIYRAGEGWSYESVGGEKWERPRAKDQLEVAQNAFERKNYRVAQKSAERVVKRWPLSDYASRAQYLLGRSYEERHMDERAFRAYQQLLQKYPKVDNFNEVVSRQFGIANRFLAGQWFKLWGYIPFFPSMDKTAQMYADMIKAAPYSEFAPQAQMNIGAAREKQKEFPDAVRAYIQAADLYRDQKTVAADAIYKAAQAYTKQAKEAEYDQSVAGKAIATFTDFIALHPDDARVPEAQKTVENLRREQARGSYTIARFYEKQGRLDGALIYYNDVLLKDRNSPHAEEAQQRINILKRRLEQKTPAKSTQEP